MRVRDLTEMMVKFRKIRLLWQDETVFYGYVADLPFPLEHREVTWIDVRRDELELTLGEEEPESFDHLDKLPDYFTGSIKSDVAQFFRVCRARCKHCGNVLEYKARSKTDLGPATVMFCDCERVALEASAMNYRIFVFSPSTLDDIEDLSEEWIEE